MTFVASSLRQQLETLKQMAKNQQVDIEIDKLTRSIENAITGDSFKTEVVELTAADISKLKKAD